MVVQERNSFIVVRTVLQQRLFVTPGQILVTHRFLLLGRDCLVVTMGGMGRFRAFEFDLFRFGRSFQLLCALGDLLHVAQLG